MTLNLNEDILYYNDIPNNGSQKFGAPGLSYQRKQYTDSSIQLKQCTTI